MIPGTQKKKAVELHAGEYIVYHQRWERIRYVSHDWVDQYYRVMITLVSGREFSLPGDTLMFVRPEHPGPAATE